MTFNILLNHFYDDYSIEDIVNLLNKAKYVENVAKDDSIILNTGITFEIQTGTKFEILYNLTKHKVIYQPIKQIELPAIAGLILTSTPGRFYDTYNSSIIVDALTEEDIIYSWRNIDAAEIEQSKPTYKFSILDTNETKNIGSFPLKKHLAETLYFFGSEFKICDDY